jgi:hypothetical protein
MSADPSVAELAVGALADAERGPSAGILDE